ncbi:hypothetical protein CLOM621_08211 [Clostridium sp. M62/1]|nr:hypothetical protein CLOM621_08211 [Clostridium sp. M62/1]
MKIRAGKFYESTLSTHFPARILAWLNCYQELSENKKTVDKSDRKD